MVEKERGRLREDDIRSDTGHLQPEVASSETGLSTGQGAETSEQSRRYPECDTWPDDDKITQQAFQLLRERGEIPSHND